MLNKRILVLMFVVAFLFVGCMPSVTPPVIENQAPTITSVHIPTTATVGVAYTYDVNATDPDNDVLTYSLITKPNGMVINSANGLISWVPTSVQTGYNWVVIVSVSDGTLSDTQSFTIVVSKPTEPSEPLVTTVVIVTPTPSAQLTSIVVEPKEMTLFVGESEAIKSVTATYEIKGFEVPIPLGDCNYTYTPVPALTDTVIVIDSNGVVKAVGEGTSIVTVEYKGKTDKITVTVSEPVSKTITIRWLEDAISFYPDGTPWGGWQNDQLGSATLIRDNGGYHYADANDFYNYLITPEAELEGSIVISGTGELTGYATYIYNELPTEDILVGQVEITIYDDEVVRVHDGTMIGTYTQWSYKFGTAEEVLVEGGYGDAKRCEGFDDKWLVRYADYIAHGEVPTL